MANESQNKVLRSFFISPEMDEILRQAAFKLNVSKGELIRTYVERGINGERQPKSDDSKLWTFDDAVTGYMTTHQSEVREVTLGNWHRYKRRHLDELADIPIADLTRARVIAFLEPYWATDRTLAACFGRSVNALGITLPLKTGATARTRGTGPFYPRCWRSGHRRSTIQPCRMPVCLPSTIGCVRLSRHQMENVVPAD